MRINGIDSSNAIPILINTEDGYVEILMSFIASKNIDDFPSQARRIAVWSDKYDAWITPGLTGARLIIGPLADNIPAGEGGEHIDLEKAQQIANESHLDKFLIEYRKGLDDDSDLAPILDGILEKIEQYNDSDEL